MKHVLKYPVLLTILLLSLLPNKSFAGARDRIFNPATSYIDQRNIYSEKSLSNLTGLNDRRATHLNNHIHQVENLQAQRGNYATEAQKNLNLLNAGRDQHLDNALDQNASYDAPRTLHLQESIANHRKYLELGVEN